MARLVVACLCLYVRALWIVSQPWWRISVAHPHASCPTADYMNKQTFLDNFWAGFKEVLGPGHKIKSLDK